MVFSHSVILLLRDSITLDCNTEGSGLNSKVSLEWAGIVQKVDAVGPYLGRRPEA